MPPLVDLIDRMMFNATFGSISAISWCEFFLSVEKLQNVLKMLKTSATKQRTNNVKNLHFLSNELLCLHLLSKTMSIQFSYNFAYGL